jgi:hypothetical protein
MRQRLRSIICLLGIAACLAACGAPSSPLRSAITALREGDKEAFVRAKAEAEEAAKVVQAAEQKALRKNRCAFLDMNELRIRSEIDAIRRLDRATLFTLPEDARLVYTLNVVGGGLDYIDVYFSQSADMDIECMQAVAENTPSRRVGLNPLSGWEDVAKAMGGDEALWYALKNWIDAKTYEYGKDQFSAKMKLAVNDLSGAGFSAKWPTKIVLSGADTMPNFPKGPDGRYKHIESGIPLPSRPPSRR